MKKGIVLASLFLSFGSAQGEVFFLGENEVLHSGIDPYYSIGVQYIGNRTFVGAGTGSKPDPEEYAYKRMFHKDGTELEIGDPLDMTYIEFPEQCRPPGHEDEIVFVYFDPFGNLDINAAEVTVPATGSATIYHTQNLQLPAHPVITVGSFIPSFPEDAEWKDHLTYRQLSEEGKTILRDSNFNIPENKVNLESTVRHYDSSELNPEQTMYTPSAFLDYDQTMLYAMGGESSHFSQTGDGGVVLWSVEYISGMTNLQPYAWWIEAIKERRFLPTDMALDVLLDPSKSQLACDPSNYISNDTGSAPIGSDPETENTETPSGGGGFGSGFLYLLGLLKWISLLRSREAIKAGA